MSKALQAALAVAITLIQFLPAVQAHPAGAQPVTKEGWFILSPESPGTANNSTFHAYLTDMGFPAGAGDTLEYNWASNNGSGPPILFEIHTHETGWTTYFNDSGVQYSSRFRIPAGNQSFMVYFVNPTAFPANVSYSFVLIAPTDLTPLVILPIAIGAAIGWFMWLRAAPPEEGSPIARPPRPESDPSPVKDKDESFQEAAEAAERRKGSAP
jgi:hypothetical protein